MPSHTTTPVPTFTPVVSAQITPTLPANSNSPNAAPAAANGVPLWIGPLALAVAVVLLGFVLAGRARR